MVQYGGDINLQSEREKSTALHKYYLQPNRNIDMFRFFFENKADPNIKNTYGVTPYLYLSHSDIKVDELKLFLQQKVFIQIIIKNFFLLKFCFRETLMFARKWIIVSLLLLF